MSQEQTSSERALSGDGLSPSCTQGARSHRRAKRDPEVELAEDIEMTPVEEFRREEMDIGVTPVRSVTPTDAIPAGSHVFRTDVDPRDAVWVPSTADSERVYCGLAADQWNVIEEASLGGKTADQWTEEVTAFLRQFRDWKYEPISERTIRHEAVYAAVLDDNSAAIRALERADENERRLLERVTEPQKQIAREIQRLSTAVLEHYYALPCLLYRGLGYHLPAIADEVFAAPDRGSFLRDEEFSVLTNFSIDRKVAGTFSEVVLEVEADEDAVASAPDLLTHTVVYYHEEGEWRPVPEAEVRLRGDELVELPREGITVAGGSGDRATLPSAVGRIPRSIGEYDAAEAPLFTRHQHRAIREAVLSFADYEYTSDGDLFVDEVDPPAAPEALDRIEVWLDIYDFEFEADADRDPDTENVSRIVEDILAKGRS